MNFIKHALFNDGKDGKRIGPIRLWKDTLKDMLAKDASDQGIIRDYQLYASSNALYSGRERITYLYTIDGYPDSLPMNYRENLRNQLSGSTKIQFISTLDTEHINWDGAQMRARLNVWEKSEEELNSEGESNKKFIEQDAKRHLNDKRNNSFKYLANADKKRNRKTFTYRTLILVSGVRGHVFDDQVEILEKYMKSSLGLTVNRVDEKLPDFLRAFSPFSADMTDSLRKQVGKNTLTDELIARMSPYTQGRVGSGSFYMGNDVTSGIARLHQFRRDKTAAENYMIVAETGGGKSYYMKALVVQFLGNHEYNVTINDIEGDEYIQLGGLLDDDDFVILNMAEGAGNYFDPTEINFYDRESAIDNNVYSMATSAVVSILKAITTNPKSINKWPDTLITQLVAQAYLKRGVKPGVENIDTWSRSKGMTLFDIWTEVEHLYNVVRGNIEPANEWERNQKYLYMNNAESRDGLDYINSQMYSYFDDNGILRSVFRKRITLREVEEAKLVICSFGLRSKSNNQMDPVQLALSQIFAAQISQIRSLASKSRGMYNVKIWEEVQRWGGLPGSEGILNTSLTGGRKMGDLNFLVSNKLSAVLSGNAEMSGILENIQGYAIGAVMDSRARADFCVRRSVMELKPELDRIAKETESVLKETKFGGTQGSKTGGGVESMVSSRDGSGGSAYTRAFLVSTVGDSPTVTKMLMPSNIEKSGLFRTGVDTSKNRTQRSKQKTAW